MRRLLASVAGLAVVAAGQFVPALAAPGAAPPVLTPAVAARVAAACPGTAPYAAALVRGATEAELVAAAPVLETCRAAVRFPHLQWKNDAAALGLAAVELSRGLLDRDPAQFQRAVFATNALRAESTASDAQIRAWSAIPDYVNPADGHVFVAADGVFCGDDGALNAAYINVAARAGAAWVETPRTSVTTLEQRASACGTAYAAASRHLSPEEVAHQFQLLDGSYNPAPRPLQTELPDLPDPSSYTSRVPR